MLARERTKRKNGPRPSVWWLLEDDDDDETNTDNDNRLLSLMREQCLEAAQKPIGIGEHSLLADKQTQYSLQYPLMDHLHRNSPALTFTHCLFEPS